MKSFIGLEESTQAALTAVNAYFFPAHFKLNEEETIDTLTEEGVEAKKRRAYETVKQSLVKALAYRLPSGDAQEKTQVLLSRLPMIYDAVLKDLQAAYEGDPAAQSIDEILLGYPAYKAITTYRIAHELHKLHFRQGIPGPEGPVLKAPEDVSFRQIAHGLIKPVAFRNVGKAHFLRLLHPIAGFGADRDAEQA